jgi:hypothetical protein
MFRLKGTEVEARLNYTLKFSPYLKENTTFNHYNDQTLKLFKEIIPLYCQDRMKRIEKAS